MLLVSCKKENKTEPLSKEKIATESKKANAFFDKQFKENLDRHPMYQTYLGIKKDADKWNDISDEFAKKELEHAKTALAWLQDSVNVKALDNATKLSYDLFKQQLENQIADFKYRFHTYPVNQMHGMQAEIPAFLINMHQISNEKDAENYIARLQNLKPLFEQLVTNLKEKEAKGIMPPKFVFAKVLEDSRNLIKGTPFDKSGKPSTLENDFNAKVNKLDVDAKVKESLKKRAKEAMVKAVLPAYQGLIETLEAQEKVASTDDGAWKLPEGEAFFNNALKRTTTTDLTAEEIHQIGLKEVARIHDEMRAIMKKVGFKGTLKEFFKFMKEDKQFYFEDSKNGREEYMTKATHMIDSMKTRLDELFITKPKAALIVKAVEPFREKSAGKAFYQQPALDGSRPGTYYANMYDMASMPSYQMEALAYHEGIPGHHMQIAIAQELKDVPMFRKFGRYTAYVEGWGLYSEFIPKEMGFYADPYSDFGRLAMELWRACRLVVDTGIHAKKWTREEGIKYYTDNTPNAELDAIKMVERHIVMPSQATAYKIGMLKILELRKKAKDALGDKFDIRKFHDVVLTNGPLPLNVLETKVDEYISSEK
ncbi:lipoprotein [Tenacibaculum holothuriorum]|uniref:Lipoprotein n=1 Tax=Tenacibaculum holothuriorum TaxID=1635173 RepID=A0A1Y2PCG3_9FLAO|nr:lipoprotein [Tenacibaculum holothuriorum]